MALADSRENHQRSYAVVEKKYSMECTKYFERYRAAYTGAAGAVYRPLVLCQPPARAVQVRRRLQDLITPPMSTLWALI
jgi:hypothetical protein